MNNTPTKIAERGRPRNFTHTAALDAAANVFWKNGFQGASLAALTDAMGIGKPSMYAAFGDKEALYLQALDHYLKHNVVNRALALEQEPDIVLAIRNFLQQSADLFTNPALPGGCFVINGTADCGGALTPLAIQSALQAAVAALEGSLRKRLERAQHEQQLNASARPDELSTFLGAALAGMAVLAKGGATRDRLESVIAPAMRVIEIALDGMEKS